MKRGTRGYYRTTIPDIKQARLSSDTYAEGKTTSNFGKPLVDNARCTNLRTIKINYLDGRTDYTKYPKGLRLLGADKDEIGTGISTTQNLEFNSKLVVRMLREARAKINFKDADELFTSLNNHKKTNESEAIFDDGFLAAGIMDKSSTWILNRLCKELGDLGLLIYFKAAKDVEESRTWKGKVRLVKTTGQGDELVAVFNPEAKTKFTNYESALSTFNADLIRKISGYAGALGFADTLHEKMESFTMDKIIAQISPKGYTSQGETYSSLEQLMSACEIHDKINRMHSDKNKQIIQALSRLCPSGELGIPNLNDIPLEGRDAEIMDFFISLRFRVDAETWEALIEFTGENGKAVSSAVENFLSPGVLNLTGHAVMDYIKKEWVDALVEGFKIEGVEARLRNAGPLDLGLKNGGLRQDDPKLTNSFEYAKKRLMDRVSQESRKFGKEIKVTEVIVISSEKKTDLEYKNSVEFLKRLGFDACTPKKHEELADFVALLHLDPQNTIDQLNLSNVGGLKRTLLTLPVWVRDPQAFIEELTLVAKNIDEVKLFLENFGN